MGGISIIVVRNFTPRNGYCNHILSLSYLYYHLANLEEKKLLKVNVNYQLKGDVLCLLQRFTPVNLLTGERENIEYTYINGRIFAKNVVYTLKLLSNHSNMLRF